jgi:hypothetical protein
MDYLITNLIGGGMIALTSVIHYELLRLNWRLLPHLKMFAHARVLFVVALVFLGHMISIWLYALVYWLLMRYADVGALVNVGSPPIHAMDDFFTSLYFSSVTYLTLGYGDIVPVGAMRMIAGAEVLNGLVMVGWTVSFTYLTMQRFWELPHFKRAD